LLVAAIATLVAAALLLVHLFVASLPGLQRLEDFAIDLRFQLRGPRAPATDKIVIVGLDDATHRRFPEIFQTRHGWARLIEAVGSYQPAVIAIDAYFGAPETLLPGDLPERVKALDAKLAGDGPGETQKIIADVTEALRGDERLAQAIAGAKHVYLGAFFHAGPRQPHATEPIALKRARLGEVADGEGGGAMRPLSADFAFTTLDAIAAGAAGAGATLAFHDDDQIVRRMPLAIEWAGNQYMSLGLAAGLVGLGKPGDTSYEVGASTMMVAGREVPLTAPAALSLDFIGANRIARISAADVVEHKVDASWLAGKLVFIGYTNAEYDKISTPLDPIADGVEMHATLAENIMTGRWMSRPPWWIAMLSTLALCAVVIATQLRPIRRRAWAPPVIALVALAAYAAIAYALFTAGIQILVGAPMVLAGTVLIAAMIGGLATEGREKAYLKAVFGQYVSGPVVERLIADPDRAKLGGERKVLTVLFSDIRGFSLFSETMAPEELAAFLGEYLTPMTELVLASGGTLDKYIGDAVMAFWGAPIDDALHAAHACEVALRMQESLAELCGGWKRDGKPAVAIGIGLNTGPMAVGNMGSVARFDYTVLGDQVNLAARLEALTKEYGVAILVGEATVAAAGDGFVFREVDLVRVKGRAGAAPVFELVGRKGATTSADFPAALALYRARDFAAARDAFTAIPDDRVAAILARRCAALVDAPPADGWDGVYDQHGK
jgi:adenylate cyclase